MRLDFPLYGGYRSASSGKMASSTRQDKVLLSYHDSLLRESDVDLLKGSDWINDKIIGFYFE